MKLTFRLEFLFKIAIIHSWNPLLIKGEEEEGRTFQKLSHLGVGLGGDQIYVNVEMRQHATLLLLYNFTVQFHLLYVCGKSKVSNIRVWLFSLLS